MEAIECLGLLSEERQITAAADDVMNVLLGTKEDVQQMYRVLCYSDMCTASSKLTLLQTASGNVGYYRCREGRKDLFEKHVTNLAQLRILGEQEYYAYFKGEGWLTAKMDSLFGTEEMEANLRLHVNMVKICRDTKAFFIVCTQTERQV